MEELASVKEEILALLEEKRYKELRLKLSDMMEVDIASIMDSMEKEEDVIYDYYEKLCDALYGDDEESENE